MVNVLDGLNLSGQRAINAADPTSAQDLATKAYVDAHASTGGGTTATRASASATTSSLATGAADSGTTMPLSAGYLLYSVATDRPARVRLYETAAARDADANRPVGTDPATGSGVVLDYVTAVAGTVYPLSPLVSGASLEAAPSASIPMRVTNNAAAGTVTVTLVWLKVE